MKLLARCFGLAIITVLMVGVLGLADIHRHHEKLISLYNGDAALIGTGNRKIAILPRAGRILKLLRRPANLVILVYVPAAWLLLKEARYLWHSYARPSYNARLKE